MEWGTALELLPAAVNIVACSVNRKDPKEEDEEGRGWFALAFLPLRLRKHTFLQARVLTGKKYLGRQAVVGRWRLVVVVGYRLR